MLVLSVIKTAVHCHPVGVMAQKGLMFLIVIIDELLM